MRADDDRDRKVVEQFAKALDQEDYQAAQVLLSAKCVYNSKSGPCTGPAQIIESHKGNGD